MRKWFPALALLGVVAIGWFFWRQPATLPGAPKADNAVQSPSPQPGPTSGDSQLHYPGQPAYASAVATAPSGNPAESASATAGAALPVAAGSPHPLQFTNFTPEIVLEKVAHAIRDYASMFGGNPVGTNPEITAALNGKNPRQAKFINPDDGMRINADGALVDPWGTPYFFHQLSGTDMEIHSAGPDRVMWTSDDLVTK